MERTHVPEELRSLLAEAEERKASAVHLEPRGDQLGVRLRVGGKLVAPHGPGSLPGTLAEAIAGAAGVTTGVGTLDIKETRWWITVTPVLGGAHICLRSLVGPAPKIGDLGLPAGFRVQRGLTLLCGAPRTGKTTTFYTVLESLAADHTVVTLERPIKRRVAGLLQMENPGADARHLLQQDPDVIGITEIHDLAVARLAFECALAGATVVSTLAVSRASRVFGRLINLGIEPYVLTSTIRQILCQVLVDGKPAFQLMEFSPALCELVLQGASEDEIEVAAINAGMVALPNS